MARWLTTIHQTIKNVVTATWRMDGESGEENDMSDLYSLVRLDLQDFVGGFEVRDRSFTATTMKIMCVFKPPPTSLLEFRGSL